MVRGGIDSDGSVIYVGRAFHEGDMIPAKVIPDKVNDAFISLHEKILIKFSLAELMHGSLRR